MDGDGSNGPDTQLDDSRKTRPLEPSPSLSPRYVGSFTFLRRCGWVCLTMVWPPFLGFMGGPRVAWVGAPGSSGHSIRNGGDDDEVSIVIAGFVSRKRTHQGAPRRDCCHDHGAPCSDRVLRDTDTA